MVQSKRIMEKQQLIEILLSKGVSEILPSKEYLKAQLEKDTKLSVYCGFDPTAPTLHIGHAITLRKLRHFQDLGHRIIFLIGDFTARIGDPTDKQAARKTLTEKEIAYNLRLYKKQASRFIRFSGKNKAVVKFNTSWLKKMRFADVLNLASHMTVDQMLKRDMFARRIEEQKPIYIHEFMYPLMQGYDSVALNVDGEVGGNDQLFNMLTGRTLLKNIANKEKFVITMKLLADAHGKKMGKSEGNMIALSDTPASIYGKVMSWTDGMIVPGFELCTDYTPDMVTNINTLIETGVNPRDIKMKLAREIVRVCYDDTQAQKAEDAFVATFQQKKVSDDTVVYSISKRTFEQIVIEEGIVDSKTELRRLTLDGAVRFLETDQKLSLEEIKTVAVPGVYKIGKKNIFTLA